MCQISKIIQHGYSIDANLQQYGQMLQNFYCFLFPFLSPLSSFFLFSSLSLSDSLSILLVLVPSLFDQFGMLTGNDDGVAPTTTARSATLDLTPTTRSHSSHSISPMLQPLDLTHAQPLSISPISPRGRRRSHALATLPFSGCGLFYFIYLFFSLQFGLICWWWWAVGYGQWQWRWWWAVGVMALSSLFESMAICLFELVLNWWWFGIWVVVVLGNWYLLVFFFFFSLFCWWFLPCWVCDGGVVVVVATLLGMCGGEVVVVPVVASQCCCGSGGWWLLLLGDWYLFVVGG